MKTIVDFLGLEIFENLKVMKKSDKEFLKESLEEILKKWKIHYTYKYLEKFLEEESQ